MKVLVGDQLGDPSIDQLSEWRQLNKILKEKKRIVVDLEVTSDLIKHI